MLPSAPKEPTTTSKRATPRYKERTCQFRPRPICDVVRPRSDVRLLACTMPNNSFEPIYVFKDLAKLQESSSQGCSDSRNLWGQHAAAAIACGAACRVLSQHPAAAKQRAAEQKCNKRRRPDHPAMRAPRNGAWPASS